jgi:hypothetical protein
MTRLRRSPRWSVRRASEAFSSSRRAVVAALAVSLLAGPGLLHGATREGGDTTVGVATGCRGTSRSECGPGSAAVGFRVALRVRDLTQRSLRLRRFSARVRSAAATRKPPPLNLRSSDAATRSTACSRVRLHAIAPRGRSGLSRFVHLSSERTLEPVRKDCSFAEKQEPQPALLLVVRCASDGRLCGGASLHAGAALCIRVDRTPGFGRRGVWRQSRTGAELSGIAAAIAAVEGRPRAVRRPIARSCRVSILGRVRARDRCARSPASR